MPSLALFVRASLAAEEGLAEDDDHGHDGQADDQLVELHQGEAAAEAAEEPDAEREAGEDLDGAAVGATARRSREVRKREPFF
jgi:hypothetical protein